MYTIGASWIIGAHHVYDHIACSKSITRNTMNVICIDKGLLYVIEACIAIVKYIVSVGIGEAFFTYSISSNGYKTIGTWTSRSGRFIADQVTLHEPSAVTQDGSTSPYSAIKLMV